ncbi:hypothetical protein C8Q72DRAFT_795692 [Fomitopsis betulina]|nr:hypothetical protein C8Q72DRAFT_795692 [Fomitopsis betulina]
MFPASPADGVPSCNLGIELTLFGQQDMHWSTLELQEWLADCIELEPAVKKYPILIDYSPVYGAQSLNHAIQNERLNLLSMLILGDCVHDSYRDRGDGLSDNGNGMDTE